MNPFYKKLGKRLKDLRRSRGLTQQELADKAGLTAAFLSYLENGTRRGSMDAYLDLAQALGLAPEAFFSVASSDAKYGKKAPPALSLEGLSVAETRTLRSLAGSLRRGKSIPKKKRR